MTLKCLLMIRQQIDGSILMRFSRYTSVSNSTIRRAVKKGKLKASQSTGKLLFKLSNVDRWLNEPISSKNFTFFAYK